MKNDPVEYLFRLVKFPTYQDESKNIPKGMKDCSSFLSYHLRELGFDVTIDELFSVTAEKEFDGEGTFLANAHFDTVPPSPEWEDALIPSSRGGKIFGLGSSDDKGSIASILAALYRLEDCRFRKLIVQFVNYEDNSIEYQGQKRLGMPYFLSKNPEFKADYGINVEPTVRDDKIVVDVGCTGRISFTVKTIGKEAHSSRPELGKNAIYDMIKVEEAIRQIPPGKYKIDDFEAEMPVNVAMINGGRAINIVPGECTINCERRLFPDEDPEKIKETIRSALNKLEGIKTELNFNPRVQLPYIVDKSEYFVKLVTGSVHQNLGYHPPIQIDRGRTDSVYLYHDRGIKTVIIGPGESSMCHSVGEYINIDRLREFTRVMTTLLSK
jgi:succinyl-diaminopimelate desuccinylase